MIAKRVKQISEVTERETQDHAKFIKTRINLTRWEFQRTLAQEEWTKSDPMYQREHYFGTHQGGYRAAVDALVGSSLKIPMLPLTNKLLKLQECVLMAHQSCW